jgi:DNA-binding MarR family transcriptional regulator
VGKQCQTTTEGLISPTDYEALFALVSIHSMLQRRIDEVLMDEHKLSFSELEVLCRLKDLEPQSVRSLSEQLICISRTRASRVMQGLVDRGYLQRSADQGDGRISLISFTPEGEKFTHEAARTFEEAVRRFFIEPLDERDIAAIRRIWRKLEAATDEA